MLLIQWGMMSPSQSDYEDEELMTDRPQNLMIPGIRLPQNGIIVPLIVNFVAILLEG
jgi:hypothetical protein